MWSACQLDQVGSGKESREQTWIWLLLQQCHKGKGGRSIAESVGQLEQRKDNCF